MTAPETQPTVEPVAPVAQATVTNLRESRKQTAAAKKAAPATTLNAATGMPKPVAAKKAPAAKAAPKAKAPKEPKGPSELQLRQMANEGIVRATWEMPLARIRELGNVPKEFTDAQITSALDRHQRYLSARCYDDKGKRVAK